MTAPELSQHTPHTPSLPFLKFLWDPLWGETRLAALLTSPGLTQQECFCVWAAGLFD